LDLSKGLHDFIRENGLYLIPFCILVVILHFEFPNAYFCSVTGSSISINFGEILTKAEMAQTITYMVPSRGNQAKLDISSLVTILCSCLLVCYVMLFYVMLCYVMLCYVMLCYIMLCYVMLLAFQKTKTTFISPVVDIWFFLKLSPFQ